MTYDIKSINTQVINNYVFLNTNAKDKLGHITF